MKAKKRSSPYFGVIFSGILGDVQTNQRKIGLVSCEISLLVHFETTRRPQNMLVIVITFYSPSCFGQETAKGPFGLRVKLPPAHLSTTHGGGFTLSL